VAAAQEKIELNIRPATVDEILPFMERAGRYTTGGLEFDARRTAESGARFVLERDGQLVAAWVLEIRDREVYILAGAGSLEQDMTQIGLGIVEGQAMQFDTVAFTTKRRALVRKAKKLGYVIDAWVMRKKLNGH
jgi:hypothetical protein